MTNLDYSHLVELMGQIRFLPEIIVMCLLPLALCAFIYRLFRSWDRQAALRQDEQYWDGDPYLTGLTAPREDNLGQNPD